MNAFCEILTYWLKFLDWYTLNFDIWNWTYLSFKNDGSKGEAGKEIKYIEKIILERYELLNFCENGTVEYRHKIDMKDIAKKIPLISDESTIQI